MRVSSDNTYLNTRTDIPVTSNQTSSEGACMRKRTLCKYLTCCLICSGGIATGSIYGTLRAVDQRQREERRITAMIQPTGTVLTDLENKAWSSECNDNQGRFEAFRKEAFLQYIDDACETAFAEFEDNLVGCKTTQATESLEKAIDKFTTDTPPKAKAHETFLKVTCEHPERVVESADKYRQQELIKGTAKAYAQLANEAWDTDCDPLIDQFKTFNQSNTSLECRNNFDSLTDIWSLCEAPNANELAEQSETEVFKTFDTQGSEFARDNENYLDITCIYQDKIRDAAQLVYTEN